MANPHELGLRRKGECKMTNFQEYMNAARDAAMREMKERNLSSAHAAVVVSGKDGIVGEPWAAEHADTALKSTVLFQNMVAPHSMAGANAYVLAFDHNGEMMDVTGFFTALKWVKQEAGLSQVFAIAADGNRVALNEQ